MINDKEHYRHILNNLIEDNIKLIAVMEAHTNELKMARAEGKNITEEWINEWQYRWNTTDVTYRMKINQDCDEVRRWIPLLDNL